MWRIIQSQNSQGNFVVVVLVFFSSFFCELFFLRQIRIFPFVINIVSWDWQKCQEQPSSLWTFYQINVKLKETLVAQMVCLQCRRPKFDPWVGKIPWRRKLQPTPVFLPGEFHGQRNGYCPWSRIESDVVEQLTHTKETKNFKMKF